MKISRIQWRKIGNLFFTRKRFLRVVNYLKNKILFINLYIWKIIFLNFIIILYTNNTKGLKVLFIFSIKTKTKKRSKLFLNTTYFYNKI